MGDYLKCITFCLVVVYPFQPTMANLDCESLEKKYPKISREIEKSNILLIGEDHESVFSVVNDIKILQIVNCLKPEVSVVFEHIYSKDKQQITKINMEQEGFGWLKSHVPLGSNNFDEYLDILNFSQEHNFLIDGGDITLAEVSDTYAVCHRMMHENVDKTALTLLGPNYNEIVALDEELYWQLADCDGNYFRDWNMGKKIEEHVSKGNYTVFYSGAYHLDPVATALSQLLPKAKVLQIHLGKRNGGAKVSSVEEQGHNVKVVIGEPHEFTYWEKPFSDTLKLARAQMLTFIYALSSGS